MMLSVFAGMNSKFSSHHFHFQNVQWKASLASSSESSASRVGRETQSNVVVVDPKSSKGPISSAIDCLEKLTVKMMYGSSRPLRYLTGNFAPVLAETPPTTELPVKGYLPVRLLKPKELTNPSNPYFRKIGFLRPNP
ncbi:hypothetical protein SAY86_030976 [Trapa natans]|uniref:Uncharacterized protein n=1 Tax=Trapa natans TaxID=22666 RepID=A0AAN7RE18_TRANT|nr:hypothetical protein SAY86_030976 [Trapa natans]